MAQATAVISKGHRTHGTMPLPGRVSSASMPALCYLFACKRTGGLHASAVFMGRPVTGGLSHIDAETPSNAASSAVSCNEWLPRPTSSSWRPRGWVLPEWLMPDWLLAAAAAPGRIAAPMLWPLSGSTIGAGSCEGMRRAYSLITGKEPGEFGYSWTTALAVDAGATASRLHGKFP
jgi:hypothetical protein